MRYNLDMNFTMDPTTIAILILIIAVLILTEIVYRLHMKLKRFLIGTSAKNLDESITAMNSSIQELEKFRLELETYLTTVERRVKKSVQAIHTVRFNPFKGTGSGGNQSFATAFINEDGNGVIISSIYSRDHVSVFSKPVKNGISEYELSNEEREAIVEARKLTR